MPSARLFVLALLWAAGGRAASEETCLLQRSELVLSKDVPVKSELAQPHAAPQDSAPVIEELLDVAVVQLHVPDARARKGDLAELQVELQQAPITSTSQSWLERMQASLTKLILGWVMFVFSIPILWFNERRSARMESLIARASSQARTIDADAKDAASLDSLVHIQKAPMHGVGEVRDKQFDVAVSGGCIRLQSEVEVFQYVETQRSETRERAGGGRETLTHYSYTEEWSSVWRDASGFQDKSKVNTRPDSLELGTSTASCEHVELGSAFTLPQGLVDQCDHWMPAHKICGASVSLAGPPTQGRASVRRSSVTAPRFARGSAAHFYMRPGDAQWKGEGPARVGDARVRFRYVPDGDATVLALRVAGDLRDTFLPYRLVARGWWGKKGILAALGPDQEGEEKRALRLEAQKDAKQLAADGSCGGGPLCCACSLVTMCFSAVMTPEVFHLWESDMNLAACLRSIADRNQTTTWALRLAGWALMFVGLYLTFSPLLTLIVVIPFLGPILSNFGAWLIWILCLVGTLFVSSTIVVLAYLAYHPAKALVYATLAAGVCLATVLASRALSA